MPKEDGTEQSNEIKQTSNIEYLPYIEFEKMATVTEKDIDVNFLEIFPIVVILVNRNKYYKVKNLKKIIKSISIYFR